MMMAWQIWLRALPGLLSLLLLGSGVTLLLWRGEERPSVAEWLGWSWMAGAGVGSMLLGLLGLALRGPWLFGALTLLALASAVAGWLGRPGARPCGWPVAGARWERWLALGPLLLVLYAFGTALHQGVLADGLFMVEFKARAAFLQGGRLPVQLFTDATRLTIHPRYPLLVPLTELWVYLGAAVADPTLAKTIFPPFFAAAAGLLFGAAARQTGRLWAGAAAATLAAGVPALLASSFTLAHGYPDYVLAALYLAAAVTLLWPGVPGGQWPLAALAAALLPWTKAEGILLWAVLAVVAAAWHGRRGWRLTLGTTGPGFAVWAAWQGVLSAVHASTEQVFSPVNAESLVLAQRRFWPVLNYFAQELGNLSSWGLLWWGLPVALLAGWHTPLRSRILLAAALAVGAVGLDVGPYLFTRLDLAYHLQTSCDRLVLHSSWVALLALALALGAPRATPARPVAP